MKTVFVLGAGASSPYGFPIGDGLREHIIAHIEEELSERTIITKQEGATINRRFRESGLTIDKFTEVHAPFSENPEAVINFAKLGISSCLTQAESSSNFNEGTRIPNQDWYRPFIQKVFDRVKTRDDFLRSCADITFVTFNYDRSLEFYILQQMNAVFTGRETPGMSFLEDPLPFDVIHVYGSLGSFAQLPYRTVKTPIHGYLGDFNLIGDTTRTDKTDKILDKLRASNQILFMGFSYQRENMKSLGLGEDNKFKTVTTLRPNGSTTFGPEINSIIYGTALNFSAERVDSIKGEFFTSTARLQNIGCRELVESYF